MILNLKLFGITKEIIGRTEVDYQLTAPVTVSRLRTELRQQYPKLSHLKSLAVAVNGEYADEELPLKESDEIVLIPPVSGG